ncbi:MAG: preprotein translocase subunit SecE [Patescibacteria group bacterium]
MSLIDFLRDTRGELKHVNWPTKRQSFWFTFSVIVISIIIAVFLGFFDFIFSTILDQYII